MVSQPHMFGLYAGFCLAAHMREDAEDVCGEDDMAVLVMKDNSAFFFDDQDARHWWIRTFIAPSAATPDTTGKDVATVELSNFQLYASIGAWNMVELMMPKVGDDEEKIELALWDALQQGHTRATRLLLLRAGSFNQNIWLESLKRCCRYGYADVMNLVLSCWPESSELKPSLEDVQSCLDTIAEYGQWHVISRLQEAFSGLFGSIKRETLAVLIEKAAKHGWDGVIYELLLIDLRKRKSDTQTVFDNSNSEDGGERNVDQDESQNRNDGAAAGAGDGNEDWLSDAVIQAAKFGGRTEALEQLLDQGADIESEDGQDATPLLLSCLTGRERSVQILLDQGADPDHVAFRSAQYRALHIAARDGNGPIIRMLLGAGASVNVKIAAPDGDTPLHLAISNYAGDSQFLEAARILLEFGADVNVKNGHHRSPLQIAIDLTKREDMIQLLLDVGGKIDKVDESEESALDYSNFLSAYWWAIDNNRPRIVRSLVKKNPRLLSEISENGSNGLETCMQYERTSLKDTLPPTSLCWPAIWEEWNKAEKPRFEADGLEIVFQGKGGESPRISNDGAITVRADHPFPPRELGLSYSYFELTILEYVAQEDSNSLECAIGLTGEFTNLVHALPGWNVWSVGYHNDNGGIYEQGSRPIATVEPYGIGQTVGCGIDYESGQYFFTCDGAVFGDQAL
ncbi:uncharacterized protein TrAtP1_001702 [Trichoderma atroviride]|uniref:uncharacterized protein n=1 Tax=Hypocrea atroviridis TaxID=63577 RepID=UPI0033250F0F|nr:hypothetical protein TrAtP1_001702 [Trichoderma atroviride]